MFRTQLAWRTIVVIVLLTVALVAPDLNSRNVGSLIIQHTPAVAGSESPDLNYKSNFGFLIIQHTPAVAGSESPDVNFRSNFG